MENGLRLFLCFMQRKIQKGEKNTEKEGKRTKKEQKRTKKTQRKRKENATEMPILGFGSGRPKGARGISAASKEKRGFEVSKCGEPRNKKRGLERDSEGISEIGGFGAFAIVKGASVGRGAWGAGQQARVRERNKRQQGRG